MIKSPRYDGVISKGGASLDEDNAGVRSDMLGADIRAIHQLGGAYHVWIRTDPNNPTKIRRSTRRATDVLVIPNWCYIEDLKTSIPPEEDLCGHPVELRRDYFILHARPPIGAYKQGRLRLRIDVRKGQAYPDVVFMGHIWHPNIDAAGLFSPVLLQSLAAKVNATGHRTSDWCNGVSLSYFLLHILALFLDTGENYVASKIRLANLEARLGEVRLKHDRDKITKHIATLEKETQGTFLLHRGCAPLIMNDRAAKQLGYRPQDQLDAELQRGKKKVETPAAKKKQAEAFDQQVAKLAKANEKHNLIISLPHRSVRFERSEFTRCTYEYPDRRH